MEGEKIKERDAVAKCQSEDGGPTLCLSKTNQPRHLPSLLNPPLSLLPSLRPSFQRGTLTSTAVNSIQLSTNCPSSKGLEERLEGGREEAGEVRGEGAREGGEEGHVVAHPRRL